MTAAQFMLLFPEFRASSWSKWRAILARLTPDVREFYIIAGRGSGKSRIVALLACYFGSQAYQRAPGERIYIGVFAPSRPQARVTFRYVVGLLRSEPALAQLIDNETRESVELMNGVIIEVITASTAAPRGRSYVLCIIEECAFLPQDQSANPDKELLRALRPALARVPGSLLAVVSSPYSRRGVLWQAWKKYHDQPDGAVVLVQAPTLELNPTFSANAIATAYEDDPAAAASEYGSEFRQDVESFIGADVVLACVVPCRFELAPQPSVQYAAFCDPAGGSGADSFTLAVSHRDQDDIIIDAIRETKPPFSPEETVRDFAHLLKQYRISTVVGDRFAGEWPREQFTKHGITYTPADRPKSDLYRDVLPLLNSGRVVLLDHARTNAQLASLERKTARGGRDSIDHPPGGHDDCANVICGAAVLAARVVEDDFVTW